MPEGPRCNNSSPRQRLVVIWWLSECDGRPFCDGWTFLCDQCSVKSQCYAGRGNGIEEADGSIPFSSTDSLRFIFGFYGSPRPRCRRSSTKLTRPRWSRAKCGAPSRMADRHGWMSVKCDAHENWVDYLVQPLANFVDGVNHARTPRAPGFQPEDVRRDGRCDRFVRRR